MPSAASRQFRLVSGNIRFIQYEKGQLKYFSISVKDQSFSAGKEKDSKPWKRESKSM